MCKVPCKISKLEFWQFFQICKFDFVLFWLGSDMNHEYGQSWGSGGGISECRYSSCSSFISILSQDVFLSWFLAATKQLYEWFSPSVRPSVRLSVRPSVCLSHLFDYVPIIVSSWNFQELLPVTKVTSMQKVKVRGQRSRSQRSQPNLTVSGL